MTTLTDQLRAIRRERKVSINTVADRSGYDRFTLSKWERGKVSPSLSRLIDWAGALGYDVRLVPRSESTRMNQSGAEMVAIQPH